MVKMLHTYKGLKRNHSALLIQIRTEKIDLQNFLFRCSVLTATELSCRCNKGG